MINIDKTEIHKLIEEQLTQLLMTARQAALQAHETATHEENKAENKYDTLGLEAAYLAEGQAKRVTELENNLLTFKKLNPKHFSEDDPITVGALVNLRGNTNKKYVFISPVAGGVTINYRQVAIMLITETSPIGYALKTSMLGDEITIKQSTDSIHFEIIELW